MNHERRVSEFLASVGFDLRNRDWLTDRQMRRRAETEIAVGDAADVEGLGRMLAANGRVRHFGSRHLE